MIPQRNISALSNRLARTGQRRVPEKVLELDYCLAWFLIGLSKTGLREYLIFKGGTALKRCYFPDYRFSEDLDFSLSRSISFEDLIEGLEAVYLQVKNDSGIVFGFGGEDRARHQNSLAMLLPEIKSKLEFRGRRVDRLADDFDKKEPRYRKLWEARLGAQMTILPSFEDVFRSARRSARGAGLFG